MQLLADRAQMAGADTARQPLLASCKSVTEQPRHDHTAGLSGLQGLQLPNSTMQLHLVFRMGFSVLTPWLHPKNLCQSSGEVQSLRGGSLDTGLSLWSLGEWWWSSWAQSLLQMAPVEKPSGAGGEHEEGNQDTSPVPACTFQRAPVSVKWVSCEGQSRLLSLHLPWRALTELSNGRKLQLDLLLVLGSEHRVGHGNAAMHLSSLKSKTWVFRSRLHFFYLPLLSLKFSIHITVSMVFCF